MLVRNYEFDKSYSDRVVIDPDVTSLMQIDRKRAAEKRPDLLIWRHAVTQPGLMRYFDTPEWPTALLKDFAPGKNWQWSVATHGNEPTTDPAKIMQLTRDASGADHTPNVNVMTTLTLRDYSERDSSVGGELWWADRLVTMANLDGFGATLIRSLIDTMKAARNAGSELFVEQITLALAKDANSPIASLTPTLHSDTFYGQRETAIFSLMESGWDEFGGAMTMPTCRMDALWDMRPIDLAKIESDLADQPLVISHSGDIMIYDGMIGSDGETSAANGLPHISSEVAGKTSRLIVLMYQRPLA